MRYIKENIMLVSTETINMDKMFRSTINSHHITNTIFSVYVISINL